MVEQDYKATLQLPKTEFAMKANLAQREPQMLAEWQAQGLYQKIRSARRGQPVFILNDGPPYANGPIHMGHALNRILKDIVIKSRTMSGYDAPCIPGWDCHGLPIELQVEKKFGKVNTKLDAKAFRAECRKYANGQMELQKVSLQRLGITIDWDNPYITMAPSYEADVIRALAGVCKAGHLVRGEKPVYWCVACGSALAEAEVEYFPKTSPAITVRFSVQDLSVLAKIFELKAIPTLPCATLIWTTTPWTLPANEGCAFAANAYYALVQHEQELLIVAEDLCASVFGDKPYTLIGRALGQALEHVKFTHPFLERTSLGIVGDHVTLDTGTGIVHTAPAHGPDDFMVGQKYGLPVENPVGPHGKFIAGTPFVEGLSVAQADPVVIELLQARGKLFANVNLEHSYPCCWRHKTPLIFRATPQWFIHLSPELKANTLAAVDTVAWLPAWGKARMRLMVQGSPDWCISRQRAWGVPIAVLIHKETQQLHPRTTELLLKVAEQVETRGVEAWYDCDPAELIGEEAKDYDKVLDVVDVWFESGVVHAAVLDKFAGQQYPADVYLEGSDQYRGWFQSSLMTAMILKGVPPYKTVITHGYIVDEQGRKMSKSLGNGIEPEQVIKTLGADVLRLWTASVDYKGETAVSDQILVRTTEAYRRIRNTARFLLANLHDFQPEMACAPDAMTAVDRWIIEQAKLRQTEIVQAYEQYQFHQVYHKVLNFCINELGAFYLDIIKDRQYTGYPSAQARRSTQTALYVVLQALVRWLAPVLSYTADEIWKEIPGAKSESVFLETWFEGWPVFTKAAQITDADWDQLFTVRLEVNKALEAARNAGIIGAGLEACIEVGAPESVLTTLKRFGTELHFAFIVSEVSLVLAEGIQVAVEKSAHLKCARCWHYTDTVGVQAEHPTICGRCVDNLKAPGELRHYV